ncbi:hypothetical protein OF83DRAFT_1093551 [Amylostereum chailletii]|nr:hypothetical protein OF83DRAFT_1093551 [Amylostereum chailletii]
MAPTTRSSAPSTPTKNQAGGQTSPKSASRKIPHCTKCQRPRAGHPRQGCPFSTPSTPISDAHPSSITEALGSMHIQPVKGEGKVSPPSQPLINNDTLTSLSTDSSFILHGLSQPGIMRDESLGGRAPGDDQSTRNGSPSKAKLRREQGRIMPGTLVTPRPSFLESDPPFSQQTEVAIPSDHATLAKQGADEDSSKASTIMMTSLRSAQPLTRTESEVEREVFLDRLGQISKHSPAAVYVVPTADLVVVTASARKLRYCTRTVTPGSPASMGTDSFLVIGMDEEAVNVLYDRLSSDGRSGKRVLNAAAGGAVAGAVATFTGLAFSG